MVAPKGHSMLFLLFHLGDDCYALDAGQVVEILPLVTIKKMLRAPHGVVGTINYHGTFVPVVDLSELALGHLTPSRLSTRIILVHCSGDAGQPRMFGLITEKTTETMRCEAADFVYSGIANDDAAYLGGIATGPRGVLVQRIELSKLLSATVPDLLLERSA
jgi:chemotaxis-related protein WspB